MLKIILLPLLNVVFFAFLRVFLNQVATLQALLDANSQVEKISVKGPDGKSHLAAIIGKKGAVIRDIRDTSGAAVDLLSVEDMVKVTGSREQVVKASAMVHKILKDEFTPAHAKLGKGEVCQDVAVPVAAVGMIIGRMGSTIKNIKESTGANVDVPKGMSGPQADSEVPTTVAKVFGAKEGVKKAVEMVQELLKKHEEQKARDVARAAANKARAAKDSAEGKDSSAAAEKGDEGSGGGADEKKNGNGNSGAVAFFGVEEDSDDKHDGEDITFSGDGSAGAGWNAEPSAGPPGLAAAPGWG
jgi:predicted PilT family ATPase